MLSVLKKKDSGLHRSIHEFSLARFNETFNRDPYMIQLDNDFSSNYSDKNDLGLINFYNQFSIKNKREKCTANTHRVEKT